MTLRALAVAGITSGIIYLFFTGIIIWIGAILIGGLIVGAILLFATIFIFSIIVFFATFYYAAEKTPETKPRKYTLEDEKGKNE